MENRKVLIEKMTKGRAGIIIPELHLRTIWEKKGAKKMVSFEALREALFEPAVNILFKEGKLYPLNKQDRIDLGLEEEEINEMVIILTDREREYLLTTATVPELKEKLATLSVAQLELLVDYAVEHELGTVAKSDIIKRACGKDIMKLTQFKRAQEEG